MGFFFIAVMVTIAIMVKIRTSSKKSHLGGQAAVHKLAKSIPLHRQVTESRWGVLSRTFTSFIQGRPSLVQGSPQVSLKVQAVPPPAAASRWGGGHFSAFIRAECFGWGDPL